jgi:hypothetical protein
MDPKIKSNQIPVAKSPRNLFFWMDSKWPKTHKQNYVVFHKYIWFAIVRDLLTKLKDVHLIIADLLTGCTLK